MNKNIKLIKTLPHLHQLFLPKDKVCIASPYYSLEVFESLQSAKYYLRKSITFSNVLQMLSLLTASSKKDELSSTPSVRYTRVEVVEEKLQFSIKGDTVTVWPVGYTNPLKLSFFGEDCEEIAMFDADTKRSIKTLNGIILTTKLPADEGMANDIFIENPAAANSNEMLEVIIFTNKQVQNIQTFHSGLEVVNTDFVFPPLFFSNSKAFQKEIERLEENNYKIIINSDRDKNLKKMYPLRDLEIGSWKFEKDDIKNLSAGFESKLLKIAFFTDRELFGTISLKSIHKDGGLGENSKLRRILRQFEGEISVDDFVVHEDYGVAIYKGLNRESVDGNQNDYLLLEFDNEDELFVPIQQISKITRYLGSDGLQPKLTKLGKGAWQEAKKKIKQSAHITAKELLEHYAKRELSIAKPVAKEDSAEYLDFIKQFEFELTNDQQTAVGEILNDLEGKRPMNRLLVGDVGFGKTEVALRAVFKVVESENRQAAILAPTTILAAQHFDVVKSRFANTDLKDKIALVSRFNSSTKNREIIDKVNAGEIRIVIGTHRLLSSDVKFKNLQMLVVDEEQKFGVKQKEKLKQLNYGVHLLSISATPIPRTLSLALSSIQDISIITTPPKGRKAVYTEIIKEDWQRAANEIQQEVSRGGQVYFVHNRVRTITAIAAKLTQLIPNIRIAVAHGQMNPQDLDKIMVQFYQHKHDVLLCTSIIENGLDLPNVNTIIVHNAHKFGLSQLYQMRGRVGRSKRKAFCYLMAPNADKHLNEKSNIDDATTLTLVKKKEESRALYMSRLQSLVDNQDLGAGFRIASKDLEIRGAGNILGAQQHGHILAVGYALYIEMLSREIEGMKVINHAAAPL